MRISVQKGTWKEIEKHEIDLKSLIGLDKNLTRIVSKSLLNTSTKLKIVNFPILQS